MAQLETKPRLASLILSLSLSQWLGWAGLDWAGLSLSPDIEELYKKLTNPHQYTISSSA